MIYRYFTHLKNGEKERERGKHLERDLYDNKHAFLCGFRDMYHVLHITGASIIINLSLHTGKWKDSQYGDKESDVTERLWKYIL